MKLLSIDEVYDIIGHFGFSQKVYIFSLCLLQIFGAHHMLLNIYTGLEPNFSCQVKEKELKNKNNEAPVVLLNHCYNGVIENCIIKFNKSFYLSYAEEWNLLCDEKYKFAMVQTVFMGGVMAGALLLGGMADYIGRLKTLFVALIGMIAFESFSAFSTSYTIYLVLRFLGGTMASLIILSSFVLSQELIGSSKRSICGIMMAIFFSIGIGLLSLLAAYTHNWRILTLIVSLEGILFVLLPFFLPESPRWLASQGKVQEAKSVLEDIAVKNQTKQLLPTHWELKKAAGKNSNKSNVMDLFSNPYIYKLTMIQIFSWWVNSMVYYALTMSASSLGSNVYVSTTLNGLVEIPACLFSVFIIDRFGRRLSICSFMLFGGSMCLILPFLAKISSQIVNILALLGKLSSSASFAMIYIHSGEIFPTVIRNTALGAVSVAARLGGMVSPFIVMLGDFIPYSHFFLIGVVTIISGLLNSMLPETAGRKMPETIEDMLDFQRSEQAAHSSGVDVEYRQISMEVLNDESNEDEWNPSIFVKQPQDKVPLIQEKI